MYEANLSWRALQHVLKPLVSRGLVQELEVSDDDVDKTKKCYEITQKGEDVLEYIKNGEDPTEIKEMSNILR